MSQFYDQASLVMVPSGYKAGKVYSQKPLSTDGELTFTRNSNATRIGPDGKLEKVRQNLLLQSNSFNTTWAFSGTGTVTTGATDPFGGTTAWTLAKTAANTFLYQSTSSFSGINTFSIYAKAGTVDQLWINHAQSGAFSSFFNLTLGTAFGEAGCVPTIVSVGGGWFRCSIAGTVTSPINLRIYPASGGSISGTTGSILIYGAQAEQGDIATDYIATTSAAVSVGPTANVPRLNYSNGCPSLLLEPQTTALLLYSEQLDNGYWGKSGTSMLANQTTSPDGYVNADKSTISSGVAYHDSLIKTYSSTAGQTYTASIFAKKGVGIEAIYFYQGDGTRVAKFNLTTGEYIGHAPTNGYSAFSSYGSVDFGNNWFRFYVTYTAATSSGNYTIGVSTDTTNTVVQINGNGTDHLYLWGANLTQTSYLQSYVPTLGASVTRLADVVGTKTVNTLLNQTNNNTLFGEIVNKKQQAGNARFAALYNSAYNNSNRILIYSSHTGSTYEFSLQYKVSDVASVISASGLSYGQPVKWACVFNGTTISLFLNGEKAGSATVTNSDNFYYMNLTDAGDMGFEYKQLLLVPSALSDTDCENLTAL